MFSFLIHVFIFIEMLADPQYRIFKEKSEIKELQINEFVFFYLMIFISHIYKKITVPYKL